MKAVLLSLLSSFALACGGAQSASDPAASPASGDKQAAAPESAATSAELESTALALKKLSQEQAEMFQLFQLLAGQVESLQGEVESLRAQQVALAADPSPPARPTRPRPDPAAVYSIPIASNPSRGSRRPLVTIVEAFEFA